MVALSLGGVPLVAGAAQSTDDDQPLGAQRIEFVPASGSLLSWNGRWFAGPLTVTAHDGGMAVVEETSLEGYLEGIREVPFEWPEAALQAQVVAARTYLAWTLARGRSSNGARYDYDICATTACQVYAGVPFDAGSDRWRAAVKATDQEILVYQGSPAQALYSSTSGGRTRSVEDVFVGSPPLPYLEGVESALEDSPFVEWEVVVTAGQLRSILDTAGKPVGFPYEVTVEQAADGDGPWEVVVAGTDAVRRFDTWEFRVLMNGNAPDVFPDDFPSERPDGRRYPQVVLSPTYEIQRRVDSIATPFGDLPILFRYVLDGNGWGHLVGMSQYGAKAMADAGRRLRRHPAAFLRRLDPRASRRSAPGHRAGRSGHRDRGGERRKLRTDRSAGGRRTHRRRHPGDLGARSVGRPDPSDPAGGLRCATRTGGRCRPDHPLRRPGHGDRLGRDRDRGRGPPGRVPRWSTGRAIPVGARRAGQVIVGVGCHGRKPARHGPVCGSRRSAPPGRDLRGSHRGRGRPIRFRSWPAYNQREHRRPLCGWKVHDE